jgi:polyisoprenyl-teichoic acid--peptidoglycan teichoic acid transferase
MSYSNQQPPRPRYDPNGATRPNITRPPIAPPPLQSPLSPPPSPKGYPPPPSQPPSLRDQRHQQRRKQNFTLGCGLVVALVVILTICLASSYVAAMFIAPVNSNILVIGIDRVPEGTVAGRTDTNILVRANAAKPSVSTLSIPRDLWVKIPGYGENRINTAHFFAEAAKPGSGPANAMLAIEQNFGIKVPYYVRVRLEGVPGLIDAMGGVTVDLPKDMGGLTAGKHHLNGTQSLAFIRDRKGTDDFFRMADGEFFIKAAAQQLLNPLTWPRLPLIYAAFQKTVDSNLSLLQLANIGVTVLRVGPANIDSNVLPREDTTPTTINGAQVLLPRWDLIHPLVDKLFK